MIISLLLRTMNFQFSYLVFFQPFYTVTSMFDKLKNPASIHFSFFKLCMTEQFFVTNQYSLQLFDD